MTAPQPPLPRSSWRRRTREIITERLGLKLIALLVAALLWLVVNARQPTEGFVSVRLVPVLDSSLVLLDEPRPLEALVAGRAADLVKLYSTPLSVRRSVGGDVPDTLVLDVSPADVRVPAGLVGAVRVLDLQPRSVTLRFESRASRRISVVNEGRIMLQTDSGPRLAVVEFEPQSVRVTGARRAVRRLRGIRPHSLLIAAGDSVVRLAELDTVGTGLRVQPVQVRVRVRSPMVASRADTVSEPADTLEPAPAGAPAPLASPTP